MRRFMLTLNTFVCLVLLVASASSAQNARRSGGAKEPRRGGDVLATLHPEHPRLYLNDAGLVALRQRSVEEAAVKAWRAQLARAASKMLDQPPVVHRLIGPRLLDQSRRAVDRVSTLALLYRLDGDRKWFERARVELLAAAAFPDWNPSHFLDTAEMSHALGLGYDWLYKDLGPSDRATIRQALVEKGLRPGLAVYRKGNGWAVVTHNWNQVCNGGLTVAALAIADEEPALAREVVEFGRRSIVHAMRSFAPDGGWAEGPGYWNYATRYNVYYLDALGTALGTDFDLKSLPGFAETGRFRMDSVGPIGQTFNYADAGEAAGTSAQMLWLAREFHQPEFGRFEAKIAERRPDAFHLIWSDGLAKVSPSAHPDMSADHLFRGVDVAFLRSDRDDPRGLFVGFKGGDNAANHSHLDLGGFVLDAAGQRWAIDLGSDDYNLPGYFGKQRWNYFRLRTESHNTLIVDGQNQAPHAKAPIVAFTSTPSHAFAVADMSVAYAPALRSARRGVARFGTSRVLVQDEFRPARPVSLEWRMLTRASIAADGPQATLSQHGATLHARLLEPVAGRFEVLDARASPPQKPQPDVRILTVRLPAVDRPARIVVLFQTDSSKPPGDHPPVEPLDHWVSRSAIGREP